MAVKVTRCPCALPARHGPQDWLCAGLPSLSGDWPTPAPHISLVSGARQLLPRSRLAWMSGLLHADPELACHRLHAVRHPAQPVSASGSMQDQLAGPPALRRVQGERGVRGRSPHRRRQQLQVAPELARVQRLPGSRACDSWQQHGQGLLSRVRAAADPLQVCHVRCSTAQRAG